MLPHPKLKKQQAEASRGKYSCCTGFGTHDAQRRLTQISETAEKRPAPSRHPRVAMQHCLP